MSVTNVTAESSSAPFPVPTPWPMPPASAFRVIRLPVTSVAAAFSPSLISPVLAVSVTACNPVPSPLSTVSFPVNVVTLMAPPTMVTSSTNVALLMVTVPVLLVALPIVTELNPSASLASSESSSCRPAFVAPVPRLRLVEPVNGAIVNAPLDCTLTEPDSTTESAVSVMFPAAVAPPTEPLVFSSRPSPVVAVPVIEMPAVPVDRTAAAFWTTTPWLSVPLPLAPTPMIEMSPPND